MLRPALLLPALALLALAAPRSAQFDPPTGQWGKIAETDVRLMTWNVGDNIRTEENKNEGFNSWTALTLVVAAMRPDVLLLQETGDNGCFGCVDTPAELETVLDLFFEGGSDPFNGGTVGTWVQRWAPGYDLPYRYVSTVSDSFNRNIILSRFPFKDLNGDSRDRYGTLFNSLPDAYAPGLFGNPIIRGLQIAELDLTNGLYVGDLVVMNCHLKSGGSGSDLAQRLTASRNIAYHMDYWYGGAGGTMPDPNATIADSPAATRTLGATTPIVIGGDFNEDEQTNGRKGPAEWIRNAATSGGAGGDGTDRDGSDSLFDMAVNGCNPADRSTQSSSKLDYFVWQDSIATVVNEFTFQSASVPTGCGGVYPPELLNFPFDPIQVSVLASDHRPVILDLRLPMMSEGINVNGFGPVARPIRGQERP